MNSSVRFVKVSGDGDDALYDLQVEKNTVAKSITFDEVVQKLKEMEAAESEIEVVTYTDEECGRNK